MQLKLTEQLAADIRARVKALDFATIEKLAKAKDQNGTFDVIISTEDIDRAGEIVRQDGWDFSNYKNNPIVLWGHDYYSLPIGVCTETYKTEVHGVPATGAKGVFYPAEINPFAQQVRRMYDYGIKSGLGVGCTTSVGFIPKEFDENSRTVITKAELLEFSFVPVPANQGVGPAEGRALTFAEAKELQLDIDSLRVKGVTFSEPEEVETKAAQAGDECTMDDGTPGELASDPNDPDGALVCIPKDDSGEKAAKERGSQKKLLSALRDEHDRHSTAVEKAFDDFREKAVVEDQGNDPDEPNAKGKKPDATMREALKDLRDTVRDEHDMHRAKSIEVFRSFDPAEDKAFSNKEHLKALRGEHDTYETKCGKALDDFEEKCMKSVQGEPGSLDEHTDWVTALMDGHQTTHKKSVTKIAKGMCKAAFGEEDQADEKVLQILSEHLSAYVPEPLQRAVFQKVGARISSATKEKLGEAHQHMKAATAIVEALHGGLGNDEGEESRSDGEDKTAPAPAPRKQRSRPTEAPANDDLNKHLFTREVLREITTAAQRGLEKINREAKR